MIKFQEIVRITRTESNSFILIKIFVKFNIIHQSTFTIHNLNSILYPELQILSLRIHKNIKWLIIDEVVRKFLELESIKLGIVLKHECNLDIIKVSSILYTLNSFNNNDRQPS